MTAGLVSPTSGRPLHHDTPHSLTDGAERWPVVDAIPFLRVGRAELSAAALARLDDGDAPGALVLLLADADDWWDGPPPDQEGLRRLVAERESLTLRDAMALLAYGRVADYFAHRWTDPTFLAGLALIEAHWAAPRSAFELACGIGHYGRELGIRGVAITGADVVFSKLWLARHWVVGPDARLLCFDAGRPWPVVDLEADLVLCQDALYFLEPKSQIVDRLRSIAGSDGVLAVGHVHNREAANHSAGAGMTAAEVAALFPDGVVYADDELTRAAASAQAPRSRSATELRGADAFSIAAGPGLRLPAREVEGLLTLPGIGGRLRRNPLYGAPDGTSGAALDWPSERYRQEYGTRATYPALSRVPAELALTPAWMAQARRRELVDLPDRW